MEIKGNWSASTKSEKSEKNSLKGLVGQSSLKVNVKISTPYKYSKGPLIKPLRIISIHNDM